MNAHVPMKTRLWLLGLGVMPVLALLLHLHTQMDLSEAMEEASAAKDAQQTQAFPPPTCEFPGSGPVHRRLVYLLVDSLRLETADDPTFMPWLVSFRQKSLSGALTPCMTQLTDSCVRTQFEGIEPNFIAGFKNFTGGQVKGPNLLEMLARRGIRSAIVADHSLLSLYAQSAVETVAPEDFVADELERDEFAFDTAMKWLERPDIDVIFVHFIGTDSVSHRFPIGSKTYGAQFQKVDRFCSTVNERLGPEDTLVVVGDHGHDLKGYHSTGILTQTAYYVRGPFFPTGRRHDLGSESILFLMSVATCQGLSPLYAGEDLSADLKLPSAYAQAWKAAHSGRTFSKEHERTAPLQPWYYWPLALLLFLGLFLQAWLAWRRGVERLSKIALGTNVAFLVAGYFLPILPVLGAAAIVNLFLLQRQLSRAGASTAAALGACLAGQVLLGATSHVFLVELQSHVMPLYYAYVIASVLALALLGGALVRRFLPGASYAERAALAGWAIVFFGLFLGPYYYGTARWLLTGVTLLLLVGGARVLRHDRALLTRALVSALLVLPLHAPVMKEWKLSYPMLAFAENLPFVAIVAGLGAIGLLFGWLTHDPWGWRKTLPAVLAFSAVAWIGQFPHASLVAGALVFLSYRGWSRAVTAIESAQTGSPIIPWLRPALQSSYAFMLYFALFRGLLFSQVEFSFALNLLPLTWPILAVVTCTFLLTFAKYMLPLVLQAWLGGEVTRTHSTILLFKLACLVSFYMGMAWVNHPSSLTFSLVLSQEILILVPMYAVVLVIAVVANRADVTGLSRERQGDSLA